MFPDYPKAKEKPYKELMERLRMRSHEKIGPFRKAQKTRMFEGDRFRIEREDGSVDDNKLNLIEETVEFTEEELHMLSLKELTERFVSAFDRMGSSISRSLYEKLEADIAEVGNTVKGKGKPFSHEMYFKVLEKISIDFDKNGNPKLPTAVVHPSQKENADNILREIFEKREYKERFNIIIEKKREEWRDREASRKLVG